MRLNLRPLALPGLSGAADALTGFLLSPLGLFSPLGSLVLPPPSTRSGGARLPSFGQIPMLQRVSINGSDWDWDALLGPDSVRASGAPGRAGGRASEAGDAPSAAVGGAAGQAGAAAAPRSGMKRARCSVTSVEDDAALLIDLAPVTKAAREGAGTDAPAPADGTPIYGLGA